VVPLSLNKKSGLGITNLFFPRTKMSFEVFSSSQKAIKTSKKYCSKETTLVHKVLCPPPITEKHIDNSLY